MTDETKELMGKARALLAAATPGAWVSAVGMNTAPAPIGEACVFSGDLCVARCGPPDAASGADAELIAFAVNNLPALLDALAAENQRADEAEAACAATLTEMQSAAHRLWELPPADRTLATDDVWRALSHFKPPVAGVQASRTTPEPKP